jgi:hypothetical protein
MVNGVSIMAFWGEVGGKSQLSVKCEPLNPDETVESTDSVKNEILARRNVMYTFGNCYCGTTILSRKTTKYCRYIQSTREMLTYCGKWELNGCHGYGKCTYVDGGTYEGEWSCNLRSGFGTMVYLRTFWGADTYMGNWLLNVRHGRGHFSSVLLSW